eukprot:9181491-Prorocentrum_lima.AAC.1
MKELQGTEDAATVQVYTGDFGNMKAKPLVVAPYRGAKVADPGFGGGFARYALLGRKDGRI